MSKGGDSSDSATTQTPAQWAAALSNTSIAAWKEADILAISLDKLQALSATQISQITVPWALPGAVWTADTLNAVPLQYWGTFGPRYLSTTSNGVTTVTPFSQLSAVASGSASGYSNWFADLGYSYQSSASKWTFSPSVVAGISTEHIARIGSGLGTASQAPALSINNGMVDTSAFEGAVSSATNKGESMKTWSFPISAAESVAGITKRSVVMFGAGWSDMGADFMGALTASQLGAIAHAEDVLGATQLGYLSANQLIALRQMDWSRVSAAQLNGITLEAFSGLQSNIITAIPEAAWRGLDKAHTQKLNAANIRLLSASKIGALQYLGYALTASVGAILTANQVASIQSGCWAQVSDTSFLNALPLSVMQSIAPSAFASMSTAVIAGMDGLHLGALTDAQALVFPLSELNDASVAFYRNPNTLNFNDFLNNPTVNWARAPASFIKLLTLEQLKLLHPTQMAQLSLAAIAGLTRSQTQALTLEQIQAFNTAQLSAAVYISRRIDVVSQIFGVFTVTRMSTAFWSRVDSSFLNALSLSAFAAITSAQMAAISSDVFAGLDKAHFDAFTITQLLALTARQVGAFRGEYLTIHFLRNVRLDSFKGLVPEQMRRLHDYLFNTVATNAFADGDPVLLATAEHQFASLLATIMDSDDGREAWLQQSVDLLIRLQWLDVAAAATLSASDVQNTYAALNWSWMSGSFLNSITTAVFSQVKASSVAQLNLNAVAALNDAHIQALTVTQAAALSGEQLSAITHLGALQASVVQGLSELQIAGINQDWSQISNMFLSNMTAWQFAALTPEQFGQMSAAQLAVSAIDWRLISPEQINALSLATFNKLCTGSNPAILDTTTGVLLSLGGEQMVILSQAAAAYSIAQTNTLLNRLFGAFSTNQISRLIDLMKSDRTEQMVLQTGLIALLAQINGSTTGIDAAIQSLVSLRSIQPSWFNVENLSVVLPVLSMQYSNYWDDIQASIDAQSLYNYVFLSQTLTQLFATRLGTNANVTLATSTSLALGNLLVMIGAGINSLGQAIETASNNKLNAKERDALIAASSLNAVASVAQGLQLGANVVLQALIRRYTARYNLDTLDNAIGVAFERQVQVGAEQGLQQEVSAPVNLPVQETRQPVTVVDRQTLDSQETVPVARPANPVDERVLLPNQQFRLPLSNVEVPLNRTTVNKATPHLLSVNESGIAIVVINAPEIDLTSRLVNSEGKLTTPPLTQDMVSQESLLAITTDYHAATGKNINEIHIYNVSGELPLDKNIRIADSISTANAGQQDIAAGRFVLNNLERFVYRIWQDAQLQIARIELEANGAPKDQKPVLNDFRLSNDVLIPKMRTVIRQLFGFTSEDWSDYGGAGFSKTLGDILNKIKLADYPDFLLDDAVLANVIWSDGEPPKAAQIHQALQRQFRPSSGKTFDVEAVHEALGRLTQNYTIESIKQRVAELGQQLNTSLTEVNEYIAREFIRLGIAIDSDVGTRAYQDMQVSFLLDYGARISADRDVIQGLLAVDQQARTDPALLKNAAIRAYLVSEAEHINWLQFSKQTLPTSYTVEEFSNGKWASDIWSSVVSVFAAKGTTPYANGFGGTELTEIGTIALNGVLHNELTRMIVESTQSVVEQETLLGALDVSSMNSETLGTRLGDTIVKFNADTEKLVLQVFKEAITNSDPAMVPFKGNVNLPSLETNMRRAVQTANTTLVESVLTAWVSRLIQLKGNELATWRTDKPGINSYIEKWVAGIQSKVPENTFLPGTFTRSSKTGDDLSQGNTQLHEHVVSKLQAIGVEEQYLFTVRKPVNGPGIPSNDPLAIAPRVPAALPENAPVELRAVVVEAAGEADALGLAREAGVGRGEFQLSRMQIAVSGVVTLSFALFASVVGIAAGIAGLIYAAQSSHLSAQAQALALAMNGVRVLSSFIMLGASVAQIASNVAKAVQVVADTTSIANAGFLIGNVIGITTNVAQIGIQIKAATDATDDTSRLIAGLAILDATIQLILNIVGTIALAFGPIGVIVNLVTFIIAALLPSAAAIATAVKYRESYDDLTSKGLFKEAEVIYMQWQTAALDASPIVNWTSSIYTPEMKKAQERRMDYAWMDKSGEERLLYALKNNTDLKSNFDNLRAQMYAGTAALNQSFVNLGQGLTRAVTLMLSQENLSYFEGDKLATVKLAATFNYLTNTVSRAPKLVSAAVNGQLVTLTFNQNLSSLNSQLPSLSAFTVKVAGVATTVSGFALLNNTITLTLASAVSAGQVVTFSYNDTTTGDDSHAVQNLLGKDAASITDHAVVNSLDADHRAPLLVDAVVEDKYLSLLFDEGLDSAVGKVPDKTAFAVTVAGSNAAIESVAVSGQRVLLTLVDKVAVGAVVSFNYTAGEQGLRDTAGNKVAVLTAQAVDNTSSTATVGASRVGWLQYDNFVASTQGTGSEAASVLNGADYTVYANDAGANAGTARLRYLSLSNAAGEFDMYSASRATENSDRIWLDASSAQGLSNFAINTSGMTVWGGQGKNSYSLSRQYANSSYIVAANSWSSDSNVVSLSGASSDSNHVVNLDYLLTADNISGGLAVAQTPFKVLGSADGLDEVIGSADNQSYYATSNVANVRLTGANANVFVGESATVNVGLNGRVLVDMDMWRGLSLSRPTAGVTNATINGSYGSYSLLNLAATDTVNDSFIGKLDLRYQIGHLPTLGAFTVNAGGANVAVTQMKISGSKVTLSLASAVQQNQAVRVSYQDVSASNDADTLQDLAGNDVGNFSAQVVSNVTADTTAPTLKVATVQGNRLIVRFSEALLQAVKPLASDFTVKVAGTAVAVSKVAFNDSSSLLLTLASPVSAGQTVSMGYSVASDTTVAVQDLAGNASSGFSDASVVNLASVAAAPGLRSVTVNGNVLTLKFDGTLRYTLSDASAFLVTADNTPMTISSVSVVGTSVLLYLASAVTSEQLVEVSYTAPQQASDTTTLRDWLGNGVASLSAQMATNITAQDLTAPTLQYAIVNGNSLVLTFSEALNGQAGFTPVPSAFAVRVAGSTVAVTQAVVSGATVTLSLATAVDYAAAVSLSYTDLSASNDVAVVQDLAGNDAASFSNINVVNNTPNTTAPSLLSATVTENQLVLLFDDSLNNNVGYLPPLTSMSVNAAGVAVGIVSGSLNGDTATLTLSRAVNPDDYVTFNYSAPASSSSTQAFQDWSGNPLLSIANFSVSNLTGLDLTPPSFVSAEVNGNTLSLTFSEALASTASFTPGLNAFSVYVDGSLNTVSAVTLNGTQAVLSLNRAVSKEQVVTVSYSQPANRPIQDGAGNFTASFSGKAVSNVTVDTSAPTLSSASVAGALLTLTFNENLATDTSLIPSAKQFAVNVDGAVVDVLSAVVAGKVVTVTLNKAVTAAQAVSVDYTPATTGTNQLQDASGNTTVRFSKTVSNWSGLASLQNATVSGTQLTLTFNQELDAISGHLPPVSAFAVQVAGVNSTVSQLVANGYKLTLTLDAAVNYGQTVTVNYTDPSTANDVAALQNLAGMDVQTFSEAYAVHNLTPQVTDLLAPSLNSAVANGSTVTLTFSEALDAGVGEWLVNYLPNGQYDAQGNPVVTSRLQASGFVNVLGSNSNDSFIIGDQSGLAASRQLNYIQLGNGQGVKVSHYDTSGNLLLAMGNTGQADVVLESGSSLQKLLTTKLVQSDADIVKYKAHRDTVTLKTLSSLTAFLAGYEVIDATESSSSLTAQIGGGDHQIKLGGQTVNLQFDKAVSTTSITTDQIPNSWLDYQYFNFNSINADGLWVGRESDGTVLFQAKWTNATSGSTDNLKVSYDGTLSNVVMGVGHVLATATSSQLRLDKLIEVMATPAFASDAAANSHAMMATDTSNDGAQTKLYRISDIVAYSAQPQSAVTGGV